MECAHPEEPMLVRCAATALQPTTSESHDRKSDHPPTAGPAAASADRLYRDYRRIGANVGMA